MVRWFFKRGVSFSWAVFAIFGFVVLGFQSYIFFDPTQLVVYIERDFAKALSGVTAERTRQSTPSLEKECFSRAKVALLSYRDLVAMVTSSLAVDRNGIIQLFESICRVLVYYSDCKNRISSESLWFPKEYVHPDWFTADYFMLNVALETGTGLQPSEQTDVDWVEHEISNLFNLGVNALCREPDLETLSQLVQLVSNAMRAAARMIPESTLEMFEAIAGSISNGYQPAATSASASGVATNQLGAFTVSTLQCYIPIGILLGFRSLCDRVNKASFETSCKKLNWRVRRSIYSNLPRPITRELEYLWVEMNAEARMEGNVCLPEWFCFRTLQPSTGGIVW
jgi:hypothetical protein